VYYVYILKSKFDGSLYIGYTANLKKRFAEHNSGLSRATKHKLPYLLIFYEAFTDRIDAKHREVYLKSGWGFRSIKKMMSRSLKNGGVA
jgi:putative endonuclease